MDLLKRIIAAFSFLTVAPIPRGVKLDADAIGRSRAFFPLPGLCLGGAYAALAWALSQARGVPPLFTALAVLVAMCLLTRCLHIDGLADLADAWGSYASRVRALEIMRDSRVGTFGVVAIVLLLGAKAAALLQICAAYKETDSVQILCALALAPAPARLAAAWLIQWFPYARTKGKGSYFKDRKPVADLLVAAVLTLAAAWLLAGVRGLILCAAATAATHLFGLAWNRRFRGLTGDIYGAAIELTETAALWAIALW